MKDLPSAISQDEYEHAEKLCEMLCVDKPVSHDPEDMLELDWTGVKERLKKPLFGFLHSQIVKGLKLKATEEIEKQEVLAKQLEEDRAHTIQEQVEAKEKEFEGLPEEEQEKAK